MSNIKNPQNNPLKNPAPVRPPGGSTAPKKVYACFSMESSLLRLCIFQTALKNTFFSWYYFRILERAGKDMISLGGYSERMFMPDRTYFLAPELTEPGRGE